MLDLVREYAKHLGIERYMEDWTMEVMGQGSVQQFGERVFEMEARTLAWKELVLQARGVKGRGEMREIMRIWQQLLLSDPYLPVELGLNKSDKFKQELLSEMEGWVTNAKNWG
jgi:hypothetical protein